MKAWRQSTKNGTSLQARRIEPFAKESPLSSILPHPRGEETGGQSSHPLCESYLTALRQQAAVFDPEDAVGEVAETEVV